MAVIEYLYSAYRRECAPASSARLPGNQVVAIGWCASGSPQARVLTAVGTPRSGWQSAESVCYSGMMPYNSDTNSYLRDGSIRFYGMVSFSLYLPRARSLTPCLPACLTLPHTVAGDYVSGQSLPLCCSRERFRVVFPTAARLN
jgi:hypothetical protein